MNSLTRRVALTGISGALLCGFAVLSRVLDLVRFGCCGEGA